MEETPSYRTVYLCAHGVSSDGLLLFSVLTVASAVEEDLLSYQPYLPPLRYRVPIGKLPFRLHLACSPGIRHRPKR